MSAAQAAEKLGVSRATLYAYVSRGLIRSEQPNPSVRERRYLTDDIEALVQRKESRRDPARAVQDALHWGTPILESGLTLIHEGTLTYRGRDALRLAATATVEDVAALLWTGDETAAPGLPLRSRLALMPSLPGGTLPEAYAVALSHAGAHDLHALDARPDALHAGASRVLTLLYAVTERLRGVPPAPDLPLHARLARALTSAPDAADLLRRALILTADHELNVSSFTARCVASGGASLHHAVLAGLCALQGSRHGLVTTFTHDLLADATTREPRVALRAAMARLGGPPGFGHPLYPDGDPRGQALLHAVRDAHPDSAAVRAALDLSNLVRRELGEYPNLDFALATLGHALRLGSEETLAVFALGRTVGWLAHAIETITRGELIRPRARYVGPPRES